MTDSGIDEILFLIMEDQIAMATELVRDVAAELDDDARMELNLAARTAGHPDVFLTIFN